MTPTELNFNGEPVGDPDEEPEPQPEPEPEPIGEEEQEPEDRLSRMERALSEMVEWARGQQQNAPPAIAQAAPSRPRPNFGENTAAAALWDRIEEVDRNNQARWEQAHEAARLQAAVMQSLEQIEQLSEKHRQERVRQGDPDISTKQIMLKIEKMGMLRREDVSFEEAVKDAYNALAFDAAKTQARNQGVRDARSPNAKIPSEYRPSPRPTVSRQPVGTNGQPVDRFSRLKADAEKSLRDFQKLSPEEREQAWG